MRASDEDEGDEASCFPASVTVRQTPHSLAMRNRQRERGRGRVIKTRVREIEWDAWNWLGQLQHVCTLHEIGWKQKYVGKYSVQHVYVRMCVTACVTVLHRPQAEIRSQLNPAEPS